MRSRPAEAILDERRGSYREERRSTEPGRGQECPSSVAQGGQDDAVAAEPSSRERRNGRRVAKTVVAAVPTPVVKRHGHESESERERCLE